MAAVACPGPDNAHVPRRLASQGEERKYVLFQAAMDGCLGCVCKLVEEEGIDPASTSNRAKYSAADFAEWRATYGPTNPSLQTACAEVARYLRKAACPGPDYAHLPRHLASQGGERKYILFQAAMDGCLGCVCKLVEEEGIDPASTSNRAQYCAADFAEWRATHGSTNPSLQAACAEVACYLRETACPGPDYAHQPRFPGSQGGARKYFLFQAAHDGCLRCVRHLVEVECVNPASASRNKRRSRAGYTAEEFAEWSATYCAEDPAACRDVATYLRQATNLNPTCDRLHA